MPRDDECDWCKGTQLVTLFHLQYAGSTDMRIEHVTNEGEVVTRRIPGRITVHCRECTKGEANWQLFKEEDRRKLWTSTHYKSERPNFVNRNYTPFDPTYESYFETYAEGLAWFARLGDRPPALPSLPQRRRNSPAKIIDQIQSITRREPAA